MGFQCVVAISLQTMVNDIVIVIGVMSEDRTCSNVGKKALQGLLRSDKFLCSELLMIDSIHRIVFIAELWQDRLVSLYIKVERLSNYFPSFNLHGCNLYNVISKYV